MPRGAIAIVLVAACGRVAFTPIDADSDAASDARDNLAPDRGCIPGLWSSDFATLPAWAETWREPSSAPVGITINGSVELTTTTTVDEYGGILTSTSGAFINRSVSIELVRAPDDASAAFGFDTPSFPWIRINYLDGVLATVIYDPPRIDHVRYVPYDAVAHRFLRLTEHAGTIYFEVSRDDIEYVILDTQPTPGFASSRILGLGAGAFEPVMAPSTAIFDNIRDCGLP